jgi:hypothetical protein
MYKIMNTNLITKTKLMRLVEKYLEAASKPLPETLQIRRAAKSMYC